MAVTVADIQSLGGAPFASTDEDRIALWLTFADARLSSDAWGSSRDDALKVLTLHYLSSDPELSGSGGGAAGTVSSMSVGDVSVSYATPSSVGSDNDLSSTFWGRLFLQMRGALKPFPFVL
jgi:hypothetical protein